MSNNRQALADLIRQTCVNGGNFMLGGGWRTANWIALDRVLGNAHGRRVLMTAMDDHLRAQPNCFNGAIASSEQDFPLTVFIAAGRNVDCFAIGAPNQGIAAIPGLGAQLLGMKPASHNDILVLDDVAASGETTERIVNACKALGLRVYGAMPLVDASPDNSVERICRAHGINYLPLLKYTDLGITPATAPPGYVSSAPPLSEKQPEERATTTPASQTTAPGHN